jgi:hypothetical protein
VQSSAASRAIANGDPRPTNTPTMAVYFNMAIDCGGDLTLAEAIGRHFDGFQVAVPSIGALTCEASAHELHNRFFVCIWPVGLGYAIPSGACRPEFANEPVRSEVREQLYSRLAGVTGYRWACFGGEVWDWVESEQSVDYDVVAIEHVIVADELAAIASASGEFVVFAPGYQRRLRAANRGR